MQVSSKTGLAALAALVVMAGNALAVGTGTVDKVSGWYPAGTNLTVTASPAANDELKGWSGDTNSASFVEATITFLVDAPKTITATFADIMHEIIASAGANGAISPSGTNAVAQGDSLEFTITPVANYHIADVLVDSVSVGATNSYTFSNVMASHTISASFAIDTYTVTFDLAGGTLVSGTLVQTVDHGGAATAPTLTPPEGYNFVSWDTAFDNVTADITVNAQYELKNYTLIYIAGANGSISGTTTQTVAHGNNGTSVTAVPADGYSFVSWDDSVLTATRQELNVTADKTVTASFGIDQYAFTVNSAHGEPTPSGTTNYDWGTVVNFSMPVATIVEGVTTQYVANGWVSTGSLESSATGTSGSFTITNATEMTWQWGTNYWIELNVATE